MDILIVEDSKEDRDLFNIYLSKLSSEDNLDFVTTEACNLQQGINKLENYHFDVILLDLKLPECEGLDTIKEIKNKMNLNNSETPIIILTGLDDYKIGSKAFDLGIKDFLIKGDFNIKDLKRSLNFINEYHKLGA